MAHYICKGTCGGTLDYEGACETEGCSRQWEMMKVCTCKDGQHGKQAETTEQAVVTKDSYGNILQNGDTVTLVKDLTLRGTSKTFKRGTKVTNVKVTDNPEEVDCKLEGMAIVLRTEFLKKIN